MMQRGTSLLFACALALTGQACNPYERFTGEVNAGAVDPAKFPAAYLGDGGNGKMPGGGVFSPVAAWVGGQRVGYHRFPYPSSLARSKDPLLASAIEEQANLVYVFDRDAKAPTGRARCRVPDSRQSRPENCSPTLEPGQPDSDRACSPYRFSPRADAVRYDEQGVIFTALPDAPGYTPFVQVVPVTVRDLECQGVKSEKTLLTATPGVSLPLVQPPKDAPSGTLPTAKPDRGVWVWPLIDPAANVQVLDKDGMPADVTDPKERFGPQGWGWYNQFLTAFLEGGALPVPVVDQGGPHYAAQRVYVPSSVYSEEEMAVVDGELGMGYDVLEAARGSALYSPICQVFTYDPPLDAMMRPAPVDSVSKIDMNTVKDQKQFFFCLQL